MAVDMVHVVVYVKVDVNVEVLTVIVGKEKNWRCQAVGITAA